MKNNFEKLNQQSIAQDEDKKSQESPEKQISIESSVKWREQNIAERTHAEALSGESYEDTAAALGSVEELRDFREKLRDVPFSSFHEVVEEMTNISKARLSEEERSGRIERLVDVMEERVSRLSPRVADLYAGILSEIKGEQYEPQYDITVRKIAELRQEGDMDILFSSRASWDMKLNRIETRLTDYLSGAKALDRREGRDMDDDIRKWREEELKKAPTKPPARRNESKPGVDPMERLKEGERAPAIWSINPAYGGYFKEQSFAKWDSRGNVWTEEEYAYSDPRLVPLCEEEDHKRGVINLTMSAEALSGQWIGLPIPYTHDLHEIEAGGRACSIQQDQNGDLVVFVGGDAGEEVEIKVVLAPSPDKKFTSRPENAVAPDMPSEFSEETNNKLGEIKIKNRGNIKRASALASFVRSRVKYLAPKDQAEGDYYNNFYNTHPNGFAGAVDEIKQADCDVANTYFAALCAKINIPVRHCVGHSVKGRDERGASSINSGTGHGWSEVWDEVKKEWDRMDATPSGDSQLEDEKEQEGGESVPGDYGGQEAIRPSDEELEELRKKLAERKEELSYTKEERRLAEGAAIELKEARQIIKEINEAERTRLPNGELVIDALSRLFNAIAESRKTKAPAYDGPVRKREGGERIEDIVRHKIGAMAGDTDPMSREKASEETKEEKIIGGFDLYMIGDKSGSMRSTVEGERLWETQRRAEYLIFSSLHSFERNLKRAGLLKENALSVRTQGISFRGDDPEDIDLDKPLSSDFSAKDKVKMWRSLTEQGFGNGDEEALSYVYEQIKKEMKENEKGGGKDNRLRLVIACSDGGYVGAEGQMQALAKELHKLNTIVVGMGLTETAATVSAVMENPPYSRGDIVSNIDDLPAMVAKYVVLEAVKLFPEKARENARRTIESAIDKFKNIK
ncbi:MAG: transglutaminase domain-containing protein [Patescibacteria group bacterium]